MLYASADEAWVYFEAREWNPALDEVVFFVFVFGFSFFRLVYQAFLISGFSDWTNRGGWGGSPWWVGRVQQDKV